MCGRKWGLPVAVPPTPGRGKTFAPNGDLRNRTRHAHDYYCCCCCCQCTTGHLILAACCKLAAYYNLGRRLLAYYLPPARGRLLLA